MRKTNFFLTTIWKGGLKNDKVITNFIDSRDVFSAKD